MKSFVRLSAAFCLSLYLSVVLMGFQVFAQQGGNDLQVNPPAPTTKAGIPIDTTNLPSNLPTFNLNKNGDTPAVTNPVTATESFLLNYVIRPIFFLSGGVAVLVIMYSAFQIITARGEEEGITAAKTTLLWAFVGLGLVMLAYTIVSNVGGILSQLGLI